MSNNILIAIVILLILFSLYLIGRDQLQAPTAMKDIVASKTAAPSAVNINLDAGFNNFKDYSKLTFDKLHCELYEQKNKHVDPLGKTSLEEYDVLTSELLMSLIKEINKVKTQKNLLQNLKLSKPARTNLDTSKLQRLYSNLLRTKDIIDTRDGQIKILKQNFKPSVVSGKQFEIDVEKQLISYLQKRLSYLRSLKPKSAGLLPYDDQDKIGKTLDTSQNTIRNILSDIDKNKNRVRSSDQINKLLSLKKYWELRLEEVKKCQKTDQGYRQGQGHQIYNQLERLGKAQRPLENEGHCMQLKKHLVLKLIREFDVIQSDFNCIKEKGKIEGELKRIESDIDRLRRAGSEYDYDPNKYDHNLEKLQKNYEEITYTLENQAKKVEVGYDAKTLKEMIANIEEQVARHKQRLDDLNTGKKTDDVGDDPQKIVNLVNQNLKMKADYCKDYQEYQRENQLLRNKLDQISAERSAQQVATQRYLAISNEIKKSLDEISKIKESITGRLRV